MRAFFLPFAVFLMGASTGASPALLYSRSLNIPPPNVPKDVARLWTSAFERARQASRNNDHQQVLESLAPIAHLPRQYGPSLIATRSLLYLGLARVATDQYDVGLETLLLARQFAHAIGDPTTISSANSALSNVYLHFSAISEAERAAELALQYSPPDSPLMVGLLIQRARLSAYSSDHPTTLRFYEQSISSARRRGNPRLESLAWRNLGAFQLRLGRLHDAEQSLHQARLLGEKNNDPGLSITYRNLVELELARHRPDDAARWVKRALASYSGAHSGYPLWALYYARARVSAAQGKLAAALTDYRTAVSQIQQTRWHLLPADSLRVSSLVGAEEVYTSFVDTALQVYREQRNPALLREAFAVAEATRALSLRLSAAAQARSRHRLPPTYQQTLAQLQAHYSASYRDTSPQARRRADELRLRLTEMEASAGLQLLHAEPPPLPQLASRLQPHQALLTFLLASPRSYVWVLTTTGLQLRQLPSRDTLTAAVRRLRDAIERNSPDFAPASADLYHHLFKPLEPLLARHSHLLLLPHDSLFELPFAALRPSPSHPYLIQRFTLELLPAAWILDPPSAHQSASSNSFLGVGDPVYNTADPRYPRPRLHLPSLWQLHAATPPRLNLPRLPASALELATCARAAGNPSPRLLLGPSASWNALLQALASQPQIIHFATHVVPSPDSPRESLLALSLRPNGEPELLTPELIAAQDLRARLVVMSGCRSGSGDIKASEGLMGLTRAWLLAGSHAVVATYWPVVDDVGLMLENFYRSLSESGSPPLALRHAQLAMLARDDFRAQPRYWASCFIFSRGL